MESAQGQPRRRPDDRRTGSEDDHGEHRAADRENHEVDAARAERPRPEAGHEVGGSEAERAQAPPQHTTHGSGAGLTLETGERVRERVDVRHPEPAASAGERYALLDPGRSAAPVKPAGEIVPANRFGISKWPVSDPFGSVSP